MTEVDIVLLFLSLEGLIFIALGYAMPGMARNPLVGIRTRATMSDERVWRETHVRQGRRFSKVGIAILVGGLALVVAPGPDWIRLALFGVLGIGGLGWFIWDTTRYANARLRHWRTVDEATEATSRER